MGMRAEGGVVGGRGRDGALAEAKTRGVEEGLLAREPTSGVRVLAEREADRGEGDALGARGGGGGGGVRGGAVGAGGGREETGGYAVEVRLGGGSAGGQGLGRQARGNLGTPRGRFEIGRWVGSVGARTSRAPERNAASSPWSTLSLACGFAVVVGRKVGDGVDVRRGSRVGRGGLGSSADESRAPRRASDRAESARDDAPWPRPPPPACPPCPPFGGPSSRFARDSTPRRRLGVARALPSGPSGAAGGCPFSRTGASRVFVGRKQLAVALLFVLVTSEVARQQPSAHREAPRAS